MTQVANDSLDVFRTPKIEAQLQKDLFQMPHHIKNSNLKKDWPCIKSATIKWISNLLTKRPDIRFAAVLVEVENFRRGPLDGELGPRRTDILIIQNVPKVIRSKTPCAKYLQVQFSSTPLSLLQVLKEKAFNPRNVPHTFSCLPKWGSILYSDSSPNQASILFILFGFQKTRAILQNRLELVTHWLP